MTGSPATRRAEDYAKVLHTLRREDAEVRFCVRCGSHVYGTASAGSDQDFLLVLSEPKARQDLLWGQNLNVVVHGSESYEKALQEQSVFAFEALFVPVEHRLKEQRPVFSHRIEPRRLFESAKSRSDADWSKAEKRFDEEPEASKKRVVHSLRVLAFANQLAQLGKITDFQIAVPWWHQVQTTDYRAWDVLADAFAPIREQLIQALDRRIRR